MDNDTHHHEHIPTGWLGPTVCGLILFFWFAPVIIPAMTIAGFIFLIYLLVSAITD